uniref:Uncharacterized protein n=1 Tax=Vespula pensylvanica TaxID=30213 RepID=A0A834PGD7_VESPE|nr:hypothetical protein H0235_001599 [Vespula pensylvanica]
MESTAGVQRDHKDDVQTRCPSTLDNTIEALSDDDRWYVIELAGYLGERARFGHVSNPWQDAEIMKSAVRARDFRPEDKIAFGQISTGVRWHSMFKGFEASRRAQSGKLAACSQRPQTSGVDATTPTPRYHSRQDISTDGYNAVGSPLGFAKRP